MRILAIADLHGVMDVYEWLVESAGKFRPGAVILAGDLLSGGWEAEQRAEAQGVILPLLKRIPCPVFYIMGNDDEVALDYEDDQIRPLHFRRLSCGGFQFVGYQFTPPFAGSTFVKPEDEIESDLRLLGPLLDKQTVLVTHAPAYGAQDEAFGGEHVGSPSLARLMDRTPVLAHIHGHIHQGFGRQGNHFNAASGGLRRAFLIDLPSLDHTVLDGG